MEEASDILIDQTVTPEKQLPVSRVTELIKREKASVEEKVRKQLEAVHAAEIEALRGDKKVTPTAKEPSVDAEAIKQLVYDDIVKELSLHNEKMAEEAAKKKWSDISVKYVEGMKQKSQIFDNFDDVVKDFDPAAYPGVLEIVTEMPNSSEIIYELANNPEKLAYIELLADRSPALARKTCKKLSDSIDGNIAAKKKTANAVAPSPLYRPQAATGGADGKEMTVADYKNAPWLRG
jgi:hypothetical protein